MKILYLEDRSYARQYIAMAFQAHPGLDYELLLASNRAEFEAQMASQHPDLVLMDIDLGSGDNGIAIAETYLKEHPDSRSHFVFLTELHDAGHYPLIARARQLGAKGFLHKSMTDPDRLAVALKEIAEYPNQFYLAPELRDQLLLYYLDQAQPFSGIPADWALQEKEELFLEWHARGHSRQEVMDRLEQHFQEKITGHQHDRIKEDLWQKFRLYEAEDVEKEIKTLVAFAVSRGLVRPF